MPTEGIHYEIRSTQWGWTWDGLGEYEELEASTYFDTATQAIDSAEIQILVWMG
jgi:hypothetical protein